MGARKSYGGFQTIHVSMPLDMLKLSQQYEAILTLRILQKIRDDISMKPISIGQVLTNSSLLIESQFDSLLLFLSFPILYLLLAQFSEVQYFHVVASYSIFFLQCSMPVLLSQLPVLILRQQSLQYEYIWFSYVLAIRRYW